MKVLKISFCIIVVLLLTQCTAIVEGGLRSSLIGSWEAYQVIDLETGEETLTDEGDFIFFIFEDRFCNSFTLEDDGSMDTYYFDGSSSSDASDGEWEYEFGDITFIFNDGDTLVRGFSQNEDVLVLPDTIAGKAKSISFLKVQ